MSFKIRERLALIKYLLRHRKLIRRFKQLAGRYQGKDVLIVGNGPSVDIKDLEAIADIPTICCNRFYLCYPTTEFRPDITLVVDSQMISDFGTDICQNAASIVVTASPEIADNNSNSYFLPLSNLDEFKFRDLSAASYIHSGDSVIVSAIQLAYFFGARCIYLYGVDHNFTLVPDKQSEDMCSGEGNHFIKDYRSGKPWYPPNTAAIERAFSKCVTYLNQRKISIFNLTPGTQLAEVPTAELSRIFGN